MRLVIRVSLRPSSPLRPGSAVAAEHTERRTGRRAHILWTSLTRCFPVTEPFWLSPITPSGSGVSTLVQARYASSDPQDQRRNMRCGNERWTLLIRSPATRSQDQERDGDTFRGHDRLRVLVDNRPRAGCDCRSATSGGDASIRACVRGIHPRRDRLKLDDADDRVGFDREPVPMPLNAREMADDEQSLGGRDYFGDRCWAVDDAPWAGAGHRACVNSLRRDASKEDDSRNCQCACT